MFTALSFWLHVSFTNPVPVQLDLLRYWNETTTYKDDCYLKDLDEKVAETLSWIS